VATLSEARAKRDEMSRELSRLRGRSPSLPGTAQRIQAVARGLASVEGELADLERQRARVRDLAQDPRHREPGAFAAPPTERNRMRSTKDRAPGYELRDQAQRAIDSAYERDVLPEAAGYMLTDLVGRDKFGLDSAYIAAIASPAYERAFAKQLSGVAGAEDVLEADEAAAMLAVGRAMSQRAMAVGEGKTGGFGVPLSLDPTILLTNDGAINPIRDLATVTTIATTTWQGVSSAGVKAEFVAEAAKSKDNSPELGAPEITPNRAQIWVPYSFEVGMDWPGLAAELAKLFADAKAVKEAEVFATGKGTENIPQGLITGATKIVETATKEVVVIADIYSTQEALAPRWQPRATWLGANKVANQIHKFVAKGDTEDAALMSDDRTEILGKPFKEVSTMSAKTTTKKERVLAYGDIASAYRIVDRIGLTVETVPVVMDEGFPTGQRGLLAWFRVGAKVIIPEAVQVLMVKE
jgi:HK97 family phage major capsid protein